MKQIKQAVAILVACVLVIQMCGCSAFGAPATTEDLLVRYVASESADNFRAKVGVALSVNALGVQASVPITADLRMEGNVAHGTATADLSALDARDYSVEFYAELLDNALRYYISSAGSGKTSWKLWSVGITDKIDIFTIVDLLSASDLTRIAKDSDPQVRYELTVPLSKLLQTAFELSSDSVEFAGMDEQDLIDAVGSNKVHVGFTKDCRMRSLDTGAMLSFRSAETNNVQVRMDIDVTATLDGYGEVDSSEIAIPKKVRDSAVPTDEPIDVIEVIGADSPLAGAVGRKR